jgi:hypothetical protein
MKRILYTTLAATVLLTGYARAEDQAPNAAPANPAAAPAGPTAGAPADATTPAAQGVIPGEAGSTIDKRAYGVLPNYRTGDLDAPYAPLTTKQKYTIARKDTLDWPSYILASAFAGLSQLDNSNPSFGQGLKGYGRRYVSSVADQDIGNFMTEAIMPSLLHQDPRYFRKGHGSFGGRIAYAASRVVISKNDAGKWGFNTSEFLGNGMVAALGNAYYPDAVGFDATMQRMFTQIGTDAISQVMKEFWPDVKHHFSKKNAGTLAGD